MTYLTIGVITLIAIGIIYACNPKATKSNPEPANQTKENVKTNSQENENPFNGLRQMALDVTSEQLGIESTDDNTKAFGIVMDWDLGNGIATVSAFETGDASMYLSSGGGVIGGGQHENVRKAVFEYLKIGQKFLDKSTKTKETPLPEKNTVNFYFLTNKGKYVGKESIPNIEGENSDWIMLFEEANKVLTELRLTTEKE